MYRFSDLATTGAAPAWVVLAVVAFDWATRVDFVRSRLGNNVNVTGLFALGAAIWLVYLIVSGRIYRQRTADRLTSIWDYGLNNLLHVNVDAEKDFHQWLNRYGVWEADVLQMMAQRHCSQQQRNDVANLHTFVLQASLFHEDAERNWWKSMLSAKLDRLSGVIDEQAGRKK